MRIRGRKAPPGASPCPDSDGTAVAQPAREGVGGSGDVADAEAMVRCSSMAPCLTCVLCGGFLHDRDAITMPECLHAFCRECIEHFTHVNINSCPKCNIDLGFNPLKKLRTDHSLQHIISPKHPAFVPLPSPSSQGHAVDHSAKKTDAYLMGAAGAGPSWPTPAANSGNQQGGAQREHTPMSLSKGEQCIKELQGMEGYRVEASEKKHSR
ncbi:E3 ubiquitin protein ligase DRIP2-like [Miscanthus floridulus]|uniref:E3 ubiquitin protein ligase DRIP2-like n=1 Tax=Miscanthus floridulus TaxID=154761 RepID=UPI0034589DA1